MRRRAECDPAGTKSLVTVVERLAHDIQQHGLASPAIIVIGDIVREAHCGVLGELAKQGA